MRIEIDTETVDTKELMALRALIDVLVGRAAEPAMTGEQRIDAALRPVDHSDEDAEVVNAAVMAGAPDKDSAGVPWDERIHSASRATVANGTWRRRKNTPDELYDTVMTEIAAGPSTAGRDGVKAFKLNDTPAPPAVSDDTPSPPADEPTPEAPVDDTPPPPTTSDEPDLSTFPKFVSAVNAKDVPAELKAYAALNKLCAESFGVAAFKDMKDRPSDWPLFYDMVG